MNDNKSLYSGLVPDNYLNIALDAKNTRDKEVRILFEKKKLPEIGWPDIRIEQLVQEIALLDSNNFPQKCGVGEREARIACGLVAKRHYNFGHGVGRSGDLAEAQPKAAGSSLMANLTNTLLLDLIREMGVHSAKKCMMVPMATGMTMMLTLLSLRTTREDAKIVLWSRIDQKSCFKSILSAGLTPIVIDTKLPKDSEGSEGFLNQPNTDIEAFKKQVKDFGAENIACILSTTSCFAPRACDDIVQLSILAKQYDIPHFINNAYGLQSTYYAHQIEQGHKMGRIDAFIQSTDKNLLVPVGGAIVAVFNPAVLDQISQTYPGRASSSQKLDVFMTLLSLGRCGYIKLVKERKEMYNYLHTKLQFLAEKFGENILETKRNPISIAFTLKKFVAHLSMIGSMLFTRGVSGCRVVTTEETKSMGEYEFIAWGGHASDTTIPYLTASASLGITKEEIDIFILKLDKVLSSLKN